MQTVAGGNVHLEGQLPREADPPHYAVGDAGDRPGAHLHVPERLGIEVHALHNPAHQRARPGAGHVDTGESAGDRGDVHLPLGMFRLQPVLAHSHTVAAPALVVVIR